MSATLRDRLDPASYLPEPSQIDVSDKAYRLAESILHQTREKIEYQHYGRSALAGAAVYVASVVVDGRESISQPPAADACGTTTMSIRAHTARLAGLVVQECDVLWLDDDALDRLQDIVKRGDVTGVKSGCGGQHIK